MGWSYSGSGAFYDGATPSVSLYQASATTAGEGYTMQIDVLILQGKLTVYGFQNTYTYTTSGTYTINDIAVSSAITFTPGVYAGQMYIGTINYVEAYEIPGIELYDSDDVLIGTVATTTDVYNGYIKICMDLSSYNEGTYRLKYTSDGFDFYSDYFRITNNLDCYPLITYYCNDNAFGFEFEETQTQFNLRLDAKLWQPSYINDRNEYFKDSRGVERVIYVNSIKKYLFTVNEQPEYIHDALRIAVKCDNFYINGVKYSYSDGSYEPKWRRSSDLAPVELEVKENKSLINANCV